MQKFSLEAHERNIFCEDGGIGKARAREGFVAKAVCGTWCIVKFAVIANRVYICHMMYQ